MSRRASFQRGQALLIVLLSLAVILTIVLSVLSKSITDVTVTSRGEESIRAFSAAEAGVEQAIIRSQTSGDFEGASFEAEVDDVGENLPSFFYPLKVASGDTATIWFVSHDVSGSLACAGEPCFTGSYLKLCWGEPGTPANSNTTPAIELSVLYLTSPNPAKYETARIARATFEPNSARTAQNAFDLAQTTGCTISTSTGSLSYPFSADINLGNLGIPAGSYGTPNGLQLAIVRFLYNSDKSHPLGVSTTPPSLFPSQGQKIKSTGKSGEAIRKVEALRLYSDLPPIFHSVLFSPSGITK